MISIPSSSNSHDARRPSARGAHMLFVVVVLLFTSAAHAGRYENTASVKPGVFHSFVSTGQWVDAYADIGLVLGVVTDQLKQAALYCVQTKAASLTLTRISFIERKAA